MQTTTLINARTRRSVTSISKYWFHETCIVMCVLCSFASLSLSSFAHLHELWCRNKALTAHSRYAGARFPFLPSRFYRKCIFCHIHLQSGSLYRSQVSVCLQRLPSSKREVGANYIITNTSVTLFQHTSPLSQGSLKPRNPKLMVPLWENAS